MLLLAYSYPWGLESGLSVISLGDKDVKNACPKQHSQNFCLSRFSYLASSNPYTKLHIKAFCNEKGKLHFSYVLEDGLLGKDLVITPKKVTIENEVFRKLSVQKTGWTGPG